MKDVTLEGPRRAEVRGTKRTPPRIYPTVNLRRMVKDALDNVKLSQLRFSPLSRVESQERLRELQNIMRISQAEEARQAVAETQRRQAELARETQNRPREAVHEAVLGMGKETPIRPPETESREIRWALSKMADHLEKYEGFQFGVGGRPTKEQWIETQTSDPVRLAETFRVFSEVTRAPIFKWIGGQIAGAVDPNSRQYNMDQYVDDRTLREALPPEQAMAIVYGDPATMRDRGVDQTKAINAFAEKMDTGMNALAVSLLAVPGGSAVGKLLGSLGQVANIAPVAAGIASAKAYEEPLQRFRPEVSAYWTLLRPTFDQIESRDRLQSLEDARENGQAVNEEDVDIARRDLTDKTVILNAAQAQLGMNEAGDSIRSRVAEDGWQALNGVTQRALNTPFNIALSPLVLPGVRLALSHFPGVDPSTDPSWDQLSAREKMQLSSLLAVRRRMHSETAIKSMNDRDIVGMHLMQPVFDYPAGTQVTPYLLQILKKDHPELANLPVMSTSLWGHVKTESPELVSFLTGTIAGYWANAKLHQGMQDVLTKLPKDSKLAQSVTTAMKRVFGEKGPDNFTKWMRKLVGGGAKGTPVAGSTAAAVGSADDVAAAAARVAKAGAAAENAVGGAGTAAGKLVRKARWTSRALKAIGKTGKVLGAAAKVVAVPALLMSIGDSLKDTIDYTTETGQQALDEEMNRQLLWRSQAPWYEQLGRDLLAVPEAVLWDREHARAATGLAAEQVLAPEAAKARREQVVGRYQRDQAILHEFNTATSDLQRIFPSIGPEGLFSAAQSLANHRVRTKSGDPQFTGIREVSAYEDAIAQKDWFKQLVPAQQQRTRDLIRLLGPDTFEDLFYFRNPETGDLTPNRAVWQDAFKTFNQPLPNRMRPDGGDLPLQYRDRFSEKREPLTQEDFNVEMQVIRQSLGELWLEPDSPEKRKNVQEMLQYKRMLQERWKDQQQQEEASRTSLRPVEESYPPYPPRGHTTEHGGWPGVMEDARLLYERRYPSAGQVAPQPLEAHAAAARPEPVAPPPVTATAEPGGNPPPSTPQQEPRRSVLARYKSKFTVAPPPAAP